MCVYVCASLYTHSSVFTAKKFDPVKHLDTVPELVNRKFNRPRIETLKKNPILAPENATSLKVKSLLHLLGFIRSNVEPTLGMEEGKRGKVQGIHSP